MRPGAAALLITVLWGTLSSAVGFSAEHVAQVIGPLIDAREQARLGGVSGEVYAEPRTAGGGRQPWEFVPIFLAPYSRELMERLDAVKAGIRRSAEDYVQSHGRLRDIRADYERALQGAGGGDLLKREVSDDQGRFHFGAVPAGRWLILAWRGEAKDVAGRPVKPSDTTVFRGNVERTGYAAVGYWRVDLEVRAGEQATAMLNDRNMWITVVTENVKVPENKMKEPRGRFR